MHLCSKKGGTVKEKSAIDEVALFVTGGGG